MSKINLSGTFKMSKLNSIMFKIPFMVTVMIIMLSVIIISVSISLAAKELNASTASGFETSVNGFSSLIDSILSYQSILIESYANIPTIKEYMSTRSEAVQDRAIRTMTVLFDNNDYIVDLFMLSLDGKVIESYNGNKDEAGEDISLMYPALWQSFVSKNYNTALSFNIYNHENYIILPVLQGVRDDNNNVVGAFIAYVNWGKIIDESLKDSKNQFSDEKTLFVINNDLDIVYHNDKNRLFSKAAGNFVIPSNQDSGLLSYIREGEAISAFFKRLSSTQWVMIERTTDRLLYAPGRKMTLIGIIIGIIGVTISAAITIWYIHGTIKPMKFIVEEAREMSEGNFSITSSINDRKDEIGELSAEMARHSQDIFNNIELKIEETSQIMNDISQTAVEQEAGVDQVNTAVTKMDSITQQNASLVEESTAASKSLLDQAKHLEDLVAFFKVK